MISSLLSSIKQIFVDMDIKYIRATVPEANYEIENELVPATGVAIQTDQTTATVTRAPSSVITVPIEIYFVFKEVSQDETLVATDLLVAQAELLAHEFYDRLSFNDIIDPSIPMEDYELQRLEAYELLDAVVSGILFSVDVPVRRDQYFCAT